MVEFVVGSIFVRTMGEGHVCQPGDVIQGHLHAFQHMSVFFNGLWRVRKFKPGSDELAFDFEREGPFFVDIEATAIHEFTYLATNTEPGRAWCIYSHRHPDGTVSEKETGNLEAYQAVGP
jgi:hypothetical protein